MSDNNKRILTMNSGSSSIKFSLCQMKNLKTIVLKGEIAGISCSGSRFYARDGNGRSLIEKHLDIFNHSEALETLFKWFENHGYHRDICAVGHRIVNGGITYRKAHLLTEELIEELHKLSPFNPEHLPSEIKAVEAVGRFFPGVKQVACFDTSFHYNMPRVAKLYGLPRCLLDEGILRYGFHGLSYEYIIEELKRVAGREEAMGKIIIAHLGHGASMAAVKMRRGMDTTMGFTPAGGLVMGSRSGDLDPGVMIYLLKEKGMSPDELNIMINHRSGILGVSETSDDMSGLLAREDYDWRAKEAIELFCYQAKKYIGGLAAVIGGLDTLIFTAGIGENSWAVRQRICEGLEFLGIHIDTVRNRANFPVISRDGSSVTVRVMKTDEELMIAMHTQKIIMEGG